jgi:hypothetical protein
MRKIFPFLVRIDFLHDGQDRSEYTITCCIDVKTISTEQCGHGVNSSFPHSARLRLGSAHLLDQLADTTARLKRLVELAMKETDPDKRDELCAEIWRILRERDEVRKALRVASED